MSHAIGARHAVTSYILLLGQPLLSRLKYLMERTVAARVTFGAQAGIRSWLIPRSRKDSCRRLQKSLLPENYLYLRRIFLIIPVGAYIRIRSRFTLHHTGK